MGVALLLITHDDVGTSLLAAAETMMCVSPIATRNLIITKEMDIEQGLTQARQICSDLDEGDGILIITDIYGSTPSNIAARLLENKPNQQRIIVTGLNLPMLIRIMNYAHLNLLQLAQKACSSASDSIFIIDKPEDCR